MPIELLLLLLLPAVFLAVCVLLRFEGIPLKKLNWFPLSCFSVILVGSVLGHEFFNVSLGPLPLTLDRLLLGVLVLVFVWQLSVNRQKIERFNYVDFVILGWLAIITFSTFSADFTIDGNVPLSRLLFFNYIPVMLYFLVRWIRLESADLKMFAAIMVAFGVYLAFTGLAETRGLSSLVYPKYILTSEFREFLGRGRGPFLNPVSNGIFLSVCICCALMWWPRATSIWSRLVVLAVALFITFGVYSTYTRSTWLSFVAGMGGFVFWPSKQYQKGVMIVTATLMAIILLPVIGDRLISFKRDQEVTQAEMAKSALMRPLFAEIAWNMFQDRPVLGVGFAQYSEEKNRYLQDPHTANPLGTTRSLTQHNVFLAYLVDMGLVGLVTLLGLLLTWMVASWRVWRDQSLDLWPRQFALINVVLLVAYCVNGMFHDVSIIPMMHTLLFFWMGVINNIHSRPEAFQKNVISVAPESLAVEGPQRMAA